MKNYQYAIKSKITGAKLIIVVCMSIFCMYNASAQAVLFDFDNAPLHSSLPITLTEGGITAHFTPAGFYGYSIQEANVLGFTPAGFAGLIIYPNTVYLADLAISFDQTISDFSIMYSSQELACDDAETMRVTAYMNGTLVGTNTRTALFPGTWPVDTLSCSFPQGFDSVVIHYDSPPPTCQDYGVIYMLDNMLVTQMNTGTADQQIFSEVVICPNPVTQSTIISFSMIQHEKIRVDIYDDMGRLVKNLYDGYMEEGSQQLEWNLKDDVVSNGIYFLNFTSRGSYRSYRVVVSR